MAGLFGGLFDFNHDGKMGCFERAMEFATFASIMDEAEKEEIVEHIAESIRQTAAAGSHFSRMLTPEEQEIMREIIREFMN